MRDLGSYICTIKTVECVYLNSNKSFEFYALLGGFIDCQLQRKLSLDSLVLNSLVPLGISLDQGGEGGYAAELFLYPRRAAVETARGRASLWDRWGIQQKQGDPRLEVLDTCFFKMFLFHQTCTMYHEKIHTHTQTFIKKQLWYM